MRRKIAIDPMGLMLVTIYDRVCEIRILKSIDDCIIRFIFLGHITLLACFYLEIFIMLYDFMTPGEIIVIKCAWFLEHISMLKNVTTQFRKFNVGLYIAVDAFGYLL